jgi:hypothetical protein
MSRKDAQIVKGLIAFWSYDSPPYVLSGTITRIDDQGYVETTEYGAGHWFKPSRILPEKAGKELRRDLEEALVSYKKQRTEHVKFENHWKGLFTRIGEGEEKWKK